MWDTYRYLTGLDHIKVQGDVLRLIQFALENDPDALPFAEGDQCLHALKELVEYQLIFPPHNAILDYRVNHRSEFLHRRVAYVNLILNLWANTCTESPPPIKWNPNVARAALRLYETSQLKRFSGWTGITYGGVLQAKRKWVKNFCAELMAEPLDTTEARELFPVNEKDQSEFSPRAIEIQETGACSPLEQLILVLFSADICKDGLPSYHWMYSLREGVCSRPDAGKPSEEISDARSFLERFVDHPGKIMDEFTRRYCDWVLRRNAVRKITRFIRKRVEILCKVYTARTFHKFLWKPRTLENGLHLPIAKLDWQRFIAKNKVNQGCLVRLQRLQPS